ncbi:hypothetical protein Bca52824_011774 [Brassica carinata]|uniref:Isopropylmalate dehydrogenase-like domain-containing protein n=1 Tax=Brassica carinata TaxID=52824 RepID=A0A8X7VVQ0_BRACI|nr:hypothetical protein Bca52824_011774 [Brassica carinata]
MEAMHAPIYFERYDVQGEMSHVPPEVMESIRKNKVCLKGGLKTPVGGGVSSLNVQLRKELDLFASLVNCFNLPGLPTRHENVDIVVNRENTEGEYAGLEHEVVPGVVEILGSHKANIMKLADGLFLESCREVAKKYPGITYNEIIVDNCCMQLVLLEGLESRLEQGASAGNVGKDSIVMENKANPAALLLSSAMMLRHLQFPSFADRLETAVKRVISEGKCRTKDLGGQSTTQQVVDAVIAKLE